MLPGRDIRLVELWCLTRKTVINLDSDNRMLKGLDEIVAIRIAALLIKNEFDSTRHQ